MRPILMARHDLVDSPVRLSQDGEDPQLDAAIQALTPRDKPARPAQ